MNREFDKMAVIYVAYNQTERLVELIIQSIDELQMVLEDSNIFQFKYEFAEVIQITKTLDKKLSEMKEKIRYYENK